MAWIIEGWIGLVLALKFAEAKPGIKKQQN
jgi:hypothetical protein